VALTEVVISELNFITLNVNSPKTKTNKKGGGKLVESVNIIPVLTIFEIQHDCHHDTEVKPKAATAVIELLMMGGKTPKTC
jgi:hypothetical protein